MEKIGKYDIRLRIGRGGFGVVYEGYDTVIERRVAVKLLRTELFQEEQLPEIRVRFKRDAQSAGRLSHPHIVTIHDYGEWDGTPYIVMEYLSGHELDHDLKRGVRFALDDVLRIMTQILGALGHAHERGVVHRDVKPSNVFLLEDGSLKVIDFGIARLEESKDTLSGAILGTPAYMSPEQFQGTRVDARSDVYSAGVILYQLLTGDQPFSGSFVTIMQQVLNQEAKPPSGLNPTISAAWDTVVARAMAKKPEARYGNARQFAEAIKLAHQAENDLTIKLGREADSDLTIAIEVTETEPESAERARLEDEERARQAAEAKARVENEARAERLAEAEAQARAEAARRVEEARREKERADAEARARREAEERATAEQARSEAEARARQEAEERAKREAEAKARAEAEARAREEAKRREEEARREQERAEAEARAEREAEERAAREAAERARQAAEAKARAEAQARAREDTKRIAEQAQRERERAEAEARAAAPAAARPGANRAPVIAVAILVAVAVGGIVLFSQRSGEDQATKAEAARAAAEARAVEEADKRAKAEALARVESERRLKLEADAAKRDAEAKREAELAAKARAEEEAKKAAEEKAKALVLKKEEEERKGAEAAAKKEAEAKAQAEAEARRKAEAQAKQEAEEKARAEAEARRRTEALAKQEAEAKAKAEAARKAEDARQAAQRPAGAFRDCDGCPEMMPIPAGSFLMGSLASEEGRDSDEGPQHRVSISRPFAAGKYEVTFDEWDACVRDGGCSHNPADQGWGRGRRPVINVSWRDAKQFTEWLARKTGKRYRLLTEAEWEYVARAGTTTAYNTGSTIATSQANYNRSRGQTAPVGSYGANAFGLYDVHANVWEWTEDCWNSNYSGAPADGSAWLSGDCSRRVLRGGAWYDGPRFVRSANRSGGTTDFRNSSFGFRLARTLE